MGLVGKLKNILFEDDEETEIPEIPKKEEKKATRDTNFNSYAELPRKEEAPTADVLDNTMSVETRSSAKEDVPDFNTNINNTGFLFPDFDETEFEQYTPKKENNVMTQVKPKREVKKDLTRKPVEIEETREVTTTKVKFKPSPIISPVYGILDKNYTPDDITSKNDSKLDVDKVRKKAFEPEAKKQTLEDKLIEEERQETARTIDELLKENSEDYTSVNPSYDKTISITNTKVEIEQTPKHMAVEEAPKHGAKEIPEAKVEKVSVEVPEETLENDLFDLIDSMYENGEDGE